MEANSKVLEYESFLNDHLKEDLRKVLEQRDKLYEEVSEYLKLKSTIEKIQDDVTPQSALRTKVDLGCNFYVQANIPNASKIFIAIGYGFFLEMTLVEAVAFINKKTESLQSKVSLLTEDACRIKGHIKLMLEGLREIQDIPAETKAPYKDVLS